MEYEPKELEGNVNVSPRSPIKEFFILIGGILGVGLAIYIILGIAADLVVPRLPQSFETKLDAMYSNLYPEAKQRTDAEIYLQKILDRLQEDVSSGQQRYKVRIVFNNKANALALPGRNIIVYSQILKKADSENEIAMVLAHEMGHFVNKDHLRGLGRRVVLLSISMTLLGNDNAITEMLENFLFTAEAKFSQKQERFADEFALDLLNDQYGNVAGATDFFEKLETERKYPNIIFFFASHPSYKNRIMILKDLIKKRGYKIRKKIPVDKVVKKIVI